MFLNHSEEEKSLTFNQPPSGCFSYPYTCIQMLNASFFIALNQFYDGVPQGSVLGTHLFTKYTYFSGPVKDFADDTHFSVSSIRTRLSRNPFKARL